MPVWARLVVIAAATRVVAAIVFYLSRSYNIGLEAPLPAEVYAALVVSFSAVGLFLIVTARTDDDRAAWLGGVLLLLAVPLTSRFVSQSPLALAALLSRFEVGAFLPAFLWSFVSQFPSPLRPALKRRANIVSLLAIAFGVAAVATNLSIALWPAEPSELGWRSWLATGQTAPTAYWRLLFLFSLIAAAVLVVRMLRSHGEDRTRVRIFVTGLAFGFLPLFVEIVVEELWPAYKALVHSPSVEPWIAIPLFGPLALVPFITAYSVIYDRVVETRVVIRAAIQHALAKYTIATATMVPFAALAIFLFQNRTEPLTSLLSGPRPLVLLAAVAAGVVSLRVRTNILGAIDRRFFREAHDAHLLVTRLVSDELISGPPIQIAKALRAEIDRTLHARADLFVLDDEGAWLRDPLTERQPLASRSTLLSLAIADAQPMDVLLEPESPLLRLPESDRSWILEGGYVLVLAFRSRDGLPTGLLALTRKRSELPFSATDRRSIGALTASLGLAIENDRLRRTPEPRTESPALECLVCSRLHGPNTSRCFCGGALEQADAPHLLRGVFRFEQRIGWGGMGVVYRATDLRLNREVAIKTLPRLSSDLAAQLEQEARAMASILHPNLAVIYGIESWRGTPFLVEEYLAGGTLAQQLGRGRMSVVETIELGVVLARVLDQLHKTGIIHCDVKPSNIGFSIQRVLKLLDFGLAHLLRDAAGSLVTTVTLDAYKPAELSHVLTKRGIKGTPAYMSPEASAGATPSASFDLWSLAVVLFEAMAGQRPFVGSTSDEVFHRISKGIRPELRTFVGDCPAEVQCFIDRALAVEFNQRPESAKDFEAQLLALRPGVT